MKTKICTRCKIELPINEFYKRSDSNRYRSYCKICYSVYYKSNKDYIRSRKNDWMHKTGRTRPLKLANDCGPYLGIYIAEQVISQYFENVQRSPMGTPGYDIICKNGYKIDVKSSCITNKKNTPGWVFNTRYNIIADYFVCLAFNNRYDLSPIHIWIIPNSNLMYKSSITITNSEKILKKWSKYEKPIGKVIECCDLMKMRRC